MSKISQLPDFDMTRYLDSNAAVAEYLTQVLADKDPAELVVALSDIDAIAQAQAGQFNARSWHFWHYRLGLADVADEIPLLPVRTFA